MKKKLLIFLVLIFLGATLVQAQSKEENCLSFSDLKPLSVKEKSDLILNVKKYIDQTESKETIIRSFFCPPTELYFKKGCYFPIRYQNIKFNLGLLYVKKNSSLVLESHSDKMSYKTNPEHNLMRAETVKKIFIYFGISPERITIKNIKDEFPIDTNTTEEGRDHNKYVGMKVNWK